MESTTLGVLLAWFDVLVRQIDALDYQHVVFVIDRQDFARDRLVFAADNLNCIAVMYLHFSRRFISVESRSFRHFKGIVKP